MPTESKPYPSWVLNEDLDIWVAPVEIPDTTYIYSWNEDTQTWENTTKRVDNPTAQLFVSKNIHILLKNSYVLLRR